MIYVHIYSWPMDEITMNTLYKVVHIHIPSRTRLWTKHAIEIESSTV